MLATCFAHEREVNGFRPVIDYEEAINNRSQLGWWVEKVTLPFMRNSSVSGCGIIIFVLAIRSAVHVEIALQRSLSSGVVVVSQLLCHSRRFCWYDAPVA